MWVLGSLPQLATSTCRRSPAAECCCWLLHRVLVELLHPLLTSSLKPPKSNAPLPPHPGPRPPHKHHLPYAPSRTAEHHHDRYPTNVHQLELLKAWTLANAAEPGATAILLRCCGCSWKLRSERLAMADQRRHCERQSSYHAPGSMVEIRPLSRSPST